MGKKKGYLVKVLWKKKNSVPAIIDVGKWTEGEILRGNGSRTGARMN